jgi:hypothetical protein
MHHMATMDSSAGKLIKTLPPGELSAPIAWALVLGLAGLGVTIVSSNFGPLITCLYTFGLFLGTIYSVPPLRLKRFAVPAFLIIATVRGFLLNFGVYYATRAALGLEFMWSPPIIFITSFVTVFAIVIAITKDLPDVQVQGTGDCRSGSRSTYTFFAPYWIHIPWNSQAYTCCILLPSSSPTSFPPTGVAVTFIV